MSKGRRDETTLREQYRGTIDRHLAWLDQHEPRHRANFARLLKNNIEAAAVEACTRRFLEVHTESVLPGEGPNGGPDFACIAHDGSAFCVEATCIPIDKATEQTGMSDIDWEGGSIGLLTKALWAKLTGRKVVQAARAVEVPTLIAIGTLHEGAGMVCMSELGAENTLTGKQMISIPIDMRVGRATGDPRMTTEFGHAAFRTPAGESMRRPIAGAILLDSRTITPEASFQPGYHGATVIRNSDALRPFDPGCLPGLPFMELKACDDSGLYQIVKGNAE